MLNRQTHTPSNESSYLIPLKFNQNQTIQHGLPNNRILLGVPSETLTGITSYLDPPSLLSLARVHGRLNSHVKNDSTWHRAFVCQFLNIGPESEIHDDVKSLMLRRSESTWRNEFIVRYRLRRRWERSRNATVSHIPVHSEISHMHLMPGAALLSSSIRYGIVSRSFPLNGKILPGYLDASGLRLGLGIGNPNAEFSPDVSACALASDGGTAKVLWGFRHGEVGVMTTPRAIDAARRPATDMVRCDVNEEHTGAVLDAIWDDASRDFAVTAGADAIVKIWDTKTFRCLWTSERKEGSLVPEAYSKVAISVARGWVASVSTSGEIAVWTGLALQSVDTFATISVKVVRVPCPVIVFAGRDSNIETHVVSALHIDPGSVIPTLLVAYEDDPHFYRLRINDTGHIETTAFGDASFGPISSLTPFFSTESSFILAGDQIGCVSVYDWNAPTNAGASLSVHCVRKFEAHEDGASVTALAWNGVTLITGSARGTSHVWDGLTFEHLRSFPSPVPRIRGGRGANPTAREREPVRQIVVGLEKELLLVGVGDMVMAWKAGPVPRKGSGGVRGRHSSGSIGKKKKDRHGVAKYMQQVELNHTISESKSMLKLESDYVRRANGRAREQQARLERLGLDEAEAVEYLLMLSRDEALQRENAILGEQSLALEEGVFEGDFDFDESVSDHGRAIASCSSRRTGQPASRYSPARSGTSTPTVPYLRVPPSNSNDKVLVLPAFRPEPMEAGYAQSSSSSCLSDNDDDDRSPPPPSPDSTDQAHFPPISASTSPTAPTMTRASSGGGIAGPSHVFKPLSGALEGGSSRSGRNGGSSSSIAGSPQSTRSASASASAWSIPLQARSSVASVSSGTGSVSDASSVRSPYSSGLRSDDEMDDELKFALELSLAEARSRGEDV
ncbi:hypothetical protein D9615_007952 [Tricholomella constricta]|uniref:F-box domain-containing protein n=1 Tax=Tricholomella constricta TaxID=117010 RepID=A0A8H5H2B9_9AGAR|nr:hypothetical protein D9615_007952 [Tricholomella constricta]